MPRRAHSRQNGSRRSWPGRRLSVQTGRLYHLCQAALSRRGAGLDLWDGHQPSLVSAGHPGCRQGRSGLLAMGYHLQDKQKRRSPRTTSTGCSWAPAFNAPASRNIQDDLRFAVPAEYRQALCLCAVCDPKQTMVPPAVWARDPSVLCDQFSRLSCAFQVLHPHFFKTCTIFH